MWKDIPGYEGLYKISSYGEVWSEHNNALLIPNESERGYLRVGLSKNGKTKHYFVHRLIALAFIPNPENKPFVCHKVALSLGGSNHLENLYWGTYQDNQEDKIRDGVWTKSMEKTRIKVKQYNLNGEYVKTFPSITEAAMEINGNAGGIVANCKGNRKTYKNYIWKYDDDKIPVEKAIQYNKIVLQINKNTKEIINEFDSIGKAAMEVNGDIGNISRVCNGKRKSAYGYIWKFKN